MDAQFARWQAAHNEVSGYGDGAMTPMNESAAWFSRSASCLADICRATTGGEKPLGDARRREGAKGVAATCGTSVPALSVPNFGGLMRNLLLFTSVVCALPLVSYGAAHAQGMEFSVDETDGEAAGSEDALPTGDEAIEEEVLPPADPPPTSTPPSEALTAAKKLFDQKKYPEAAIAFQGIASGSPQDTPANMQEAQYFLGRAFYELELYQSALSVFDEISMLRTGHLFYQDTLKWLAALALKLPEPANLSQKVGRYNPEDIKQFDTEEGADMYSELLYLMGKARYNRKDFQAAVDILGRVDKESPRALEAKFVTGVAYVQLKKAKPAIKVFRDIVEMIDDGVKNEEKDRYLNLAWLSLARVYYTAANRMAADGGREVDARLLGNAVASWNSVEPTSEYWVDALFEASWAFFLADEYARALGNIHTIFSPYFQDSYYPESYIIKAVTFFVNCQADNASAMVAKFHERFDPVRREMQAELKKYPDNEAFFNLLVRVRDGNDTLKPSIRSIFKAATSDRMLLRHVEYVSAMKREEEVLAKIPGSFRSSAAGSRVVQDIAVAKAFAIDAAGDLARSRIDRAIQQLQTLQNQADTIDLEITTFQRGQLSQEAQQQQTAAAQSKGGDVEVDEEHQIWPFDGEYWRDELGFYRQQVTNQCGR